MSMIEKRTMDLESLEKCLKKEGTIVIMCTEGGRRKKVKVIKGEEGDRYAYDVEIWREVTPCSDDFVYCGCGKYCKDLESTYDYVLEHIGSRLLLAEALEATEREDQTVKEIVEEALCYYQTTQY